MKNKKGVFLIVMGLLLIVAALSLVGYNLLEDQQAEQSVNVVLEAMENYLPQKSPSLPSEGEPSQSAPVPTESTSPETPSMPQEGIPDHVLNPHMPMPVLKLEGKEYIGVLEIPECELMLPVISQWSYPNLKSAPCRYHGSVYSDDMVIVAHNYKSHFRRLKELQPGDEVRFTDVDGNVFTYEVVVLETLEPTSVEEMISGEWDLTLFTCTTGGSHRLTVRCQRVS